MPARAELIACHTCGGVTQTDAAGRTRGENLLLHLRVLSAAARASAGNAEPPAVTVTSVRCLWACKRSCAVALRSRGRVGYVIADLEPNEQTAQALLDYASRYARSADGAVPYKEWPALLKGHFLCRIPSYPEAEPAATAEVTTTAAAAPATADLPLLPPDEPARSKDRQLP